MPVHTGFLHLPSPVTPASWFVVFEYEPVGHVHVVTPPLQAK
jgi:hypothetical protein